MFAGLKLKRKCFWEMEDDLWVLDDDLRPIEDDL